MKRGVPRLVLLLFVVFVLGGLAGAGAVGMYVRHVLHGFIDAPPEQLTDVPMLWLLEQRVKLTDEQREKAKAILAAHRDELRAIHRTQAPQIIALRRKETDELMPFLDVEQRAQLEGLFAEAEARVERWLALPPQGAVK